MTHNLARQVSSSARSRRNAIIAVDDDEGSGKDASDKAKDELPTTSGLE
jgi:hypothetical protein